MTFLELKECPKCKELLHKQTGFRKGKRVCTKCEGKKA
jgi:DNA-directed RNA polymerase subunit M/transcription elongation factor TFIIS